VVFFSGIYLLFLTFSSSIPDATAMKRKNAPDIYCQMISYIMRHCGLVFVHMNGPTIKTPSGLGWRLV
jgi:hypothetical protein